MTPDVNVLVAASRNDHPHHRVAHQWLEQTLAEAAAGRTLWLLPMVVAGFLRLATHPKVFAQPTPTADAIAFVDGVLAFPGVRIAELGAEWPRLRAMCLNKTLRANDLPDAWIAAAVQQMGDQLASFDVDFKKLLKKSEFVHLAA
ncbi:MAG: PIN domain-containing protein [Burkholderiaceae bacterium]|nr:PIN domain-containing protein [Burkholderiaceae bacterium]